MVNERLSVPHDLLERYRELGSKRKTADHYGVTHPTVDKWLKEIAITAGDNARFRSHFLIQQTQTHKAINVNEGQVCSVLEICDNYVKVKLPYMINHVKVPEDILERIPVREEENE